MHWLRAGIYLWTSARHGAVGVTGRNSLEPLWQRNQVVLGPIRMRRPRARQLNQWAAYFRGTGCVKFANGAVVELTVAEEELFELLLATPKITVSWERMTYELARSEQTVRHLMRGLRDKLGSKAVRTHTGRGISLQPHFIGTARFALAQPRIRRLEATAAS